MEQSESVRLEIEKEFPRSADGYDPEAVDRHLRAVAGLLERRTEGDASWDLSLAMADEVRRVGESASARVQEIVGVAERSGAAIVEHAEAQASAIVEHAEVAADTIRRQALEQATKIGEDAERQARSAHERAQAQNEELREAMATASTLLERLGSAGALVGELNAVSERIASAPSHSHSHADGGDDGGEPAAPVRVSYRGATPAGRPDPAATADESQSHPLSMFLSKAWLMGEPIRAPGTDEDEPVVEDVTSGEASGRRELETYTVPKMRVAAFNRLVRGSARDDVAVYLRESFGLTEDDDDLVEATLDEATVSTREWHVPSPVAAGKPAASG